MRNDDYWATDAEGNQLPYLDSIEFRPIPDPVAAQGGPRRRATSRSCTPSPPTRSTSSASDADDGELVAYESCAWGEDEEFLLMFNNGAEPFNDPIAREAVSRAIDRQALIENIFGDTFQIANGPYAPGLAVVLGARRKAKSRRTTPSGPASWPSSTRPSTASR